MVGGSGVVSEQHCGSFEESIGEKEGFRCPVAGTFLRLQHFYLAAWVSSAELLQLRSLPPNPNLQDISVCIRLWNNTRKRYSSCGRMWIPRQTLKRASRPGSLWDGRSSCPWTKPAFP